VTLSCSFLSNAKRDVPGNSNSDASELYLRWDKADLTSFYAYTGSHLSVLCSKLDENWANFGDALKKGNNFDTAYHIETSYDTLVNILCTGAKAFVPRAKKNYYKYWWTEELDLLKRDSVDSNNLWKVAGKPRFGPIFTRRQSCRLLYRKRLRDEQNAETYKYSNELHEALLKKDS